ncbi:MAG TPA: DUF2924 domain-containing protein [Candidatus Krumholzibacteria bacterium]|nr:DUF2924 domain-containing protein [Candidatus Krumholzibacteria bacterium]HPD73294.1 DUF2924 domain-containing protein [Candidatus Krumholzibacteria bacterium]HRY42010.1 DUF2924 domain-containing protein [Candidatus Krumholzibacteria bacterium]
MATKRSKSTAARKGSKKAKATATPRRSSRRKTKVAVFDATQAAPGIASSLADAAAEFIDENTKPKRRGRKPAAPASTGRQRKQYDLAPGTTLTRTFKGNEIKVKVTADGFVYEGETFKSISALARHIVGYQISGPVFFGLTESSSGEAKS